MEKISLRYYNGSNFGDALSPRLVSWLSGMDVSCEYITRADMAAVGSILANGEGLVGSAMASGSLIQTLLSSLRYKVEKPLLVWGSGFLSKPVIEKPVVLRRIDCRAVRGKYTLEVLKAFGLTGGDGVRVAFGDPGLLYKDMLPHLPDLEYDIGIVPHEMDKLTGEFVANTLSKYGFKIKVIDVNEDGLKVIDNIAKCDCIISSSLHGLIVADSLGIANRQMVLSYFGRSVEDHLFKFKDYYSSYGMDLPTPFLLQDIMAGGCEIIREIKQGAHPTQQQVEDVRGCLLNVFPYKRIH